MVVFVSGWGKDIGDQGAKFEEVGFVVDLSAVHISDERAEEVPGEFDRRDIGAALGDRFGPGVDDKGTAFVLKTTEDQFS